LKPLHIIEMSNQSLDVSEDERRKKDQLDSILDAALLDLGESDESENEEDVSSTVGYPPESAPGSKKDSTTNSSATQSINAQKMEPKSLDGFDGEKLEKDLEKMMQHLLLGGKSDTSNYGDMNGLDELFSEKSLEGLIEQIEKQQKVHEQAIHETTKKKEKQKKSPSSPSPPSDANRKIKKEVDTENCGKASSPIPPKEPLQSQHNSNETDVDRTVAKLLSDMAKGAGEASEPDFNMEPGNIEAMGEEMMENMMKEFEKMGQKGDANDVIDGMMKQLLSKDIMYEPMKKVNDRYPRWLAEHKERLSKDDYNRYGQQYQYFQRIVAVYETEPDNFPRLTELMQDIQEFGQPPADIIKELAPELEFDEEGMPKMDFGMGMPGMGMQGIPQFPGNENCSLM